jgi:glucose/arabinose dehydrogenase
MKLKSLYWIIPAGVLVIIALISGIWSARAASDPQVYLPVIAHGVALPPADEAAQRISVPAGFAIRSFAQGLNSPRFMVVGPDGSLYVALFGAGQIARLPDKNDDGLADRVQIVASGLNLPHNMEFHNGSLYVAENDKIERLSNQDANGVFQSRALVTDNIPGAGGHASRTLHFGPDGKLYVSAGSSCNICVESDPRRAAILRFNADGSIPSDNPFANDPNPLKRPVWATGMRNPVDFLFTPSGALWADQNGSDGLGDNKPPEEVVNVVQKGGWYGWPYCYTDKLGLNQPAQPEVPDTRMTPPAGVTCAQAIPALLTDLAHSAPLGMTLSSTVNFPPDYKNDLFIAYHGSWNTNDPANFRDCKVERVVVQNGVPVSTETFANGWRAPGALCGSSSTWGRPAGVTFGADGGLYISDDAGGRIYRVVYIGK